MKTVNTVDMRADLGDILNRVEFKGESLVVIRYGRQCALLTPMPDKQIVSDPTAAVVASGTAAETGAGKSPEKLRKNPKKA